MPPLYHRPPQQGRTAGPGRPTASPTGRGDGAAQTAYCAQAPAAPAALPKNETPRGPLLTLLYAQQTLAIFVSVCGILSTFAQFNNRISALNYSYAQKPSLYWALGILLLLAIVSAAFQVYFSLSILECIRQRNPACATFLTRNLLVSLVCNLLYMCIVLLFASFFNQADNLCLSIFIYTLVCMGVQFLWIFYLNRSSHCAAYFFPTAPVKEASFVRIEPLCTQPEGCADAPCPQAASEVSHRAQVTLRPAAKAAPREESVTSMGVEAPPQMCAASLEGTAGSAVPRQQVSPVVVLAVCLALSLCGNVAQLAFAVGKAQGQAQPVETATASAADTAEAAGGSDTVHWVVGIPYYHPNKNCPLLMPYRASGIVSGTLEEAKEAGCYYACTNPSCAS